MDGGVEMKAPTSIVISPHYGPHKAVSASRNSAGQQINP